MKDIFLFLLMLLPLYSYSQDLLGGQIQVLDKDSTGSYIVNAKIYTNANMNINRNSIQIATDFDSYYTVIPKINTTLLRSDIRMTEYEGPVPFIGIKTLSVVYYKDSLLTSKIANTTTNKTYSIFVITNHYWINVSGLTPTKTHDCLDIMNTYTLLNDTLNYQMNCLDTFGLTYEFTSFDYHYFPDIDSLTIPQGMLIDSTGLITWVNPPDSGLYMIPVLVRENEIYQSYHHRLLFFDMEKALVSTTKPSSFLSEVKLYPNPTSSQLTIEWQTPHKNLHLQLINAVGQVIYEADDLQSNQHKIEMSEMAKGIYFVRLTDGQRQWTEKVLRW